VVVRSAAMRGLSFERCPQGFVSDQSGQQIYSQENHCPNVIWFDSVGAGTPSNSTYSFGCTPATAFGLKRPRRVAIASPSMPIRTISNALINAKIAEAEIFGS